MKKDSNKDKNKIKKETIWTLFIENTGYLLFINPLSWLKSTHKVHNLLLEKHIIWLLLWDNAISKYKFNSQSGEIPLSIYLLKNTININKFQTNINSIYNRLKYKINDVYFYLDNILSIPLGFFLRC